MNYLAFILDVATFPIHNTSRIYCKHSQYILPATHTNNDH